jgi:hypothetical protein
MLIQLNMRTGSVVHQLCIVVMNKSRRDVYWRCYSRIVFHLPVYMNRLCCLFHSGLPLQNFPIQHICQIFSTWMLKFLALCNLLSSSSNNGLSSRCCGLQLVCKHVFDLGWLSKLTNLSQTQKTKQIQ